MTRQVIAGVAALIGAYLLYVSADPASSFGTAFVGFWIGVILFVAVAWLLLRFYHPGTEAPDLDEVDVREWRVFRFLRYGREATPLYLGLRLFLALEWLTVGLHKAGDPKWVQTGEALRAFSTRAATVPAPPASSLITFPAYRAFIQFMLDNHWDSWFASVIAYGEILIGLGFLFGGAGWLRGILCAIDEFFVRLRRLDQHQPASDHAGGCHAARLAIGRVVGRRSVPAATTRNTLATGPKGSGGTAGAGHLIAHRRRYPKG